jgi:hypothetical protein
MPCRFKPIQVIRAVFVWISRLGIVLLLFQAYLVVTSMKKYILLAAKYEYTPRRGKKKEKGKQNRGWFI